MPLAVEMTVTLAAFGKENKLASSKYSMHLVNLFLYYFFYNLHSIHMYLYWLLNVVTLQYGIFQNCTDTQFSALIMTLSIAPLNREFGIVRVN